MRYSFICNVCGSENDHLDFEELDRETGRCATCGSLVRLRAFVHLLGQHLFGADIPIRDWPENHDVIGYGISDWPAFSAYFGPKLTYVNTQFDPDVTRAPVMDVARPPHAWAKTADFIFCSEVLEHVAPPVQLAFDGLFSLLKPGGRLIFSVPYTLRNTVEHFPNLHRWSIETSEDGARRLFNTTKEGRKETFESLCFHGGGREVLEMRIFGFDDLKAHLRAAGFTNIRTAARVHRDFGIRFARDWSLPIVAQRPLRRRKAK